MEITTTNGYDRIGYVTGKNVNRVSENKIICLFITVLPIQSDNNKVYLFIAVDQYFRGKLHYFGYTVCRNTQLESDFHPLVYEPRGVSVPY